ncbi:MAG: hypothetical protein KW804_02125 [Candidatus Doudnabacteria bacterium]|nr:hypothetical protein [Candidatus Doudnabacteria bacterium]
MIKEECQAPAKGKTKSDLMQEINAHLLKEEQNENRRCELLLAAISFGFFIFVFDLLEQGLYFEQTMAHFVQVAFLLPASILLCAWALRRGLRWLILGPVISFLLMLAIVLGR